MLVFKKFLPAFIFIILLIWRTWYGLSQNFWHEDIIQIYLLGLKYFTTGLWPYFGPDIVHTQQQIPGALQSLLIGIPLTILKLPEAPFIFVNLLSMAGIIALAYFYSRRFQQFSLTLILTLIATLPVALQISTNVYNPSYLLFPTCLFFVGWFESQSEFRSLGLSSLIVGFLLGFSLSFIFQIHMSWPILAPFLILAFLRPVKILSRKKLLLGFCIGALICGSLLFPTILKYGLNTLWTSGTRNSDLALDQVWNAPNTILKLVTLGSYEFFGFNLGASMSERVSIIRSHYLLIITAMIMVAAFFMTFFILIYGMKKANQSGFKHWPEMKLFAFTAAWCAFIFLLTPRPAAIRNIFLLLPITVATILSCLVHLKTKYPKKVTNALGLVIFASIIFHTILSIKMTPEISIYKDYARVNEAIQSENYEILGQRRPGLY